MFNPVGGRLLADKIAEYDPPDLMMWLTADRGVKALMQESKPQEEARRLLIAAACKVCETERSEILNYFLVSLRESPLFKSLSEYLSSVCVSSSSFELKQLTKDLLELLEHYMTFLPSDSASTAALLILVIESRLIPALGMQSHKSQLARVKDMVEETMRSKSDEASQGGGSANTETSEGDPPDDFRDISIFPTVDDLNNPKPFLRRNIINGSFPNLETYLDIQFRLLREDFIKPLRDGIRECKANGDRVISREVKVYHGVKVLFPGLSPQVI